MSGKDIVMIILKNKILSKVSGFMMAYKLYIRIKMRGVAVEKQIQWVLSYMQGGLANV